MVFPIRTLKHNKQLAPGEYSFPFSMQLPAWLPASFSMGADAESKLQIRYFLKAQFVPFDENINVALGISPYRCDRLIFIHRPATRIQKLNLEYFITSKVGGFMGLNKSYSSTDFLFEKNEFYPGEEIKVKIACNNSACDKAVRSFKFKIHREFRATTGQGSLIGESYLHSVKEKGCKAREMTEHVFKIKVPEVDPEMDSLIKSHKDEEESIRSLTPSISGGIFTIKYTLRVFVKHDSWNEFGEGKFFNLPIKIIQPPIRRVSKIHINAPYGWSPSI